MNEIPNPPYTKILNDTDSNYFKYSVIEYNPMNDTIIFEPNPDLTNSFNPPNQPNPNLNTFDTPLSPIPTNTSPTKSLLLSPTTFEKTRTKPEKRWIRGLGRGFFS